MSAEQIALDLEGLEVYFDQPPAAGAPASEQRFHLRIPELRLSGGKMVGIAGRSGEGKSTLLHVLALLLRPPVLKRVTYRYPVRDGEQVTWRERSEADDAPLSEAEREKVRNESFGFIFQSHFLLPYFDVADNVALPVMVRPDFDRAAMSQPIGQLLTELGLDQEHRGKRPGQLSGGQNQRVAVARALLHEPPFLFADEPTANLDKQKRALVLRRLRAAADRGRCVVLVSHELGDLAQFCDTIYVVQENKLDDPFDGSESHGVTLSELPPARRRPDAD